MQREIWFYRVLGSFVPCHWKGFAVLFGFVTLTLVGMFSGQFLLDALGYREADWLALPLIFLAGFVPMMIIAHRHSK